ncbi:MULTISPECIES: phage tail tube protein [unclassified Paenibacillus]|uniref:phage tail tube protein n=1 Tax=unclassified Paenibacillus TaxID=185978 RepID=UPI0009555109|nr:MULTISPECIES: phage tail tube protein [unclassified Paenibacillus]ASS66478.1 phage tail tube protein [Paenibacillus sp. RUD330]SIQ03159.1 Phage tail tube protein [Paenibacillus sp. RU4X]SIQ22816.1 Phage tail tube protein [Paenibacillus sp. RU4T]
MTTSFLRAGDTLSGYSGTAFATIDGQNVEMFFVKNLRATAKKNKADIKTLGNRNTQKKATGWEGTGTMTIYYVTSRFREMMEKYIHKGIDTYFDITITNEDPASTIGKQVVSLIGVNLDEIVMAALDVESDALDEEVPFTFHNVLITDTFTDPIPG